MRRIYRPWRPARSLIWLLVIAWWTGWSIPAFAQTLGGPRPAGTSPRKLGFLTSYKFHLNAIQTRANGDDRFSWDTDIGADMDVFDLDILRGNVFANFEAIVGDEFRPVDPNQNNYIMDLSVFVRLPRGELGTTFHHVSRHLSDRSKSEAVAWNMLGVTYGDRFSVGAFELDVGGRAFAKVGRSGVDYDNEVNGHVRLVRAVNDRLSIIVDIDGTVVGVDAEVFGRDTQYGGRVEGGVRIRGGVWAAELFIGRERRIDAVPFERRPIRWTQLGFRFVVG